MPKNGGGFPLLFNVMKLLAVCLMACIAHLFFVTKQLISHRMDVWMDVSNTYSLQLKCFLDSIP